MKVKPLKNHLLIKLVKKESETKSGIILVGGENDDTNIAQVVETADHYDEEQEIFLKGDKILIDPSAGTKVKMEEEEYLLIHAKDVLAIIN